MLYAFGIAALFLVLNTRRDMLLDFAAPPPTADRDFSDATLQGP